MTALVNDPARFAADSLAAFCRANGDRVAHVPGGAVRRDPVAGRVAIVMGGGSGHHPAFAGWVGEGLADAAVCGNVFSSPSEHQILRVARAADQGGGILFVPINYAGDILHFSAAMDALRREGVDARMAVVADDIASGASDVAETRRGIAGALVVAKVAGALAARGADLDEVERVARAAIAATRSFGVAFSGCSLPGSEAPLFSVPDGRMAVGMGIHGEPGLAEHEIGTADEVADVLIDGLLDERALRPGQRVAVVVNGLGATKYDELDLVFARVAERLEDAGMQLVAPLVGEYMTSLDMAGVSVSLGYLDDELDELWRDPVDSVALSRRRVAPMAAGAAGADVGAADVDADEWQTPLVPGSEPSSAAARHTLRALEAAVAVLETEQAELGRIDAVAGDGDHGTGMVTGAHAARDGLAAAVDVGAGLGTALRSAGERWSATAGGTSGALWGAGLTAAGLSLGDADAPGAEVICAAVEAYADAIVSVGKGELGDKTMVDAIVPFAEALRAAVTAGQPIVDAWRSAAAAATSAAQGTARLVPKRGRARIHESTSIGTPDAGAVSFALIVSAALV